MLEKRVVTFPPREKNKFKKFSVHHNKIESIQHKQRFSNYKQDVKNYLNFSVDIDPEEKTVLGQCVVSDKEIVPCIPPRFYKKLNSHERIREKNKILNKLFSFAKNHQPQIVKFQSEKPEIMDNIVKSIKMQIENLPELGGKIKSIQWYTALNTPLDYQHGIDGWIEIEEQGEDEPIRLSFDLKTGNRKPNAYNPHGIATFHINTEYPHNQNNLLSFSEKNIEAIESFEKKLMDEYKHKKELLYRY